MLSGRKYAFDEQSVNGFLNLQYRSILGETACFIGARASFLPLSACREQFVFRPVKRTVSTPCRGPRNAARSCLEKRSECVVKATYRAPRRKREEKEQEGFAREKGTSTERGKRTRGGETGRTRYNRGLVSGITDGVRHPTVKGKHCCSSRTSLGLSPLPSPYHNHTVRLAFSRSCCFLRLPSPS